jgi:hypothetical protein
MENNKQQTAVEWLAIYLKGITSLNCDEVIAKAKEMEKQQERMYSEEDMRKAIQETITLMRYKATEFREHENTVIEQFKK